MLGLPKRAEILMRRFLVEEEDEPVELVSSYFRAGLDEGTDLGRAESLNGSTREHLEARKKVRFDHVTERVSARLPERAEVELLDLPDGVPILTVLVVVRAMSPGKRCKSLTCCFLLIGKSWKTPTA